VEKNIAEDPIPAARIVFKTLGCCTFVL